HRRSHVRRDHAIHVSLELRRRRFHQLHAQLLSWRARLRSGADARHVRSLLWLGPAFPNGRFPAFDLLVHPDHSDARAAEWPLEHPLTQAEAELVHAGYPRNIWFDKT